MGLVSHPPTWESEETLHQDVSLSDRGSPIQADLLQMPEPHVTALFQVAKRTARRLAETPAVLAPCLADVMLTDQCVNGFLVSFGARVFRGPLSQPELASYEQFYREQTAAHGAKAALTQVVAALLMSPRALYRYELGPAGAKPGEVVSLTAHEKASALSYFVTDGPPDEQLTVAAESGALETGEQIAAQVGRLSTQDLAFGLTRFFEEHLRSDGVTQKNPDPETYPAFKRDLLDAMAEESRAFVSHVLFRDDARFETLLTANYTLASPELASHYVAVPGPVAGGPVTLPATRAGLLTRGSFLAHWAFDQQTDIVRRGKFVRQALLCQTLPAPPEDVDVTPPIVPAGAQQRELLTEHSANEKCSGCHALMDPIGIVFEQFDAVGAFRELEAGRAISTSSTIPQVDGAELRVSAPLELAQALARSPEAQACIVSALYRYAHGRDARGRDSCTLETVGQSFSESRGNLLQSAISIATAANFFERVAP